MDVFTPAQEARVRELIRADQPAAATTEAPDNIPFYMSGPELEAIQTLRARLLEGKSSGQVGAYAAARDYILKSLFA